MLGLEKGCERGDVKGGGVLNDGKFESKRTPRGHKE